MMSFLQNKELFKVKNKYNYIRRSLSRVLDFSGVTLLIICIALFFFKFWLGFSLAFIYYVSYIVICFIENKYLITELSLIENIIFIRYLKYNNNQEPLQIDLSNINLKIFDNAKGSLFSTHLVVFNLRNKTIVQYSSGGWTFEIMKEVKAKIEKEKQRLSEEN